MQQHRKGSRADKFVRTDNLIRIHVQTQTPKEAGIKV